MDVLIKHLLFAMLLIIVSFCSSQAIAIEVVTNLNVPEMQLTQSQLRRIYTMRQVRWSDNSGITVFVLPSQNTLHHRFAKERLQIFPYQLNRIWHKLTYSGLGVAPSIVDSEEALIEAVKNTPGSIGYINDRSLIDIRLGEGIDTSHAKGTQQAEGKGGVNVIKIKD